MANIAFASTRFLDLLRPYTANLPDDALADRLREASAQVVGKLELWRRQAAPSGKNDGKWSGEHNGKRFHHAIHIEASTGDIFSFAQEPQAHITRDPDAVEFYTPTYSESLEGGSASVWAAVPAGASASGLVLIYAVTLKSSATGLPEEILDDYYDCIRYYALAQMRPFLTEQARRENYMALYVRHINAAMLSPHAPPMGIIPRSPVAPPARVRSGRWWG